MATTFDNAKQLINAETALANARALVAHLEEGINEIATKLPAEGQEPTKEQEVLIRESRQLASKVADAKGQLGRAKSMHDRAMRRWNEGMLSEAHKAEVLKMARRYQVIVLSYSGRPTQD